MRSYRFFAIGEDGWNHIGHQQEACRFARLTSAMTEVHRQLLRGSCGCNWLQLDILEPTIHTWAADQLPEVAPSALLQSKTRPYCDGPSDGMVLKLPGVSLEYFRDMNSLAKPLRKSVRIPRKFPRFNSRFDKKRCVAEIRLLRLRANAAQANALPAIGSIIRTFPVGAVCSEQRCFPNRPFLFCAEKTSLEPTV